MMRAMSTVAMDAVGAAPPPAPQMRGGEPAKYKANKEDMVISGKLAGVQVLQPLLFLIAFLLLNCQLLF